MYIISSQAHSGRFHRPWRVPRVVGAAIALVALACSDFTPTTATPRQALPFVITTANNQVIQVPRLLQVLWRGGNDADLVSWESSDDSVAQVSPSGLVTASFPGTARITARRGSASAMLTVIAVASELDVLPGVAVLELGDVRSLIAVARDADGAVITGLPIEWSSENVNVAIVDARTGVLTAMAKGFTIVTAFGGGAQGSVSVHVDPDGPRPAFTVIGSTANHFCGLEANTGLAYCWGDNHAGALGIGEVEGSDLPVAVRGGRHFNSLSVGSYATCGIETATALTYCWGSNRFGDLGDGSFTTQWEPTLVARGAIRFRSISASGSHTCGIEVQTGHVYCWGTGALIGDGTPARSSTPTLVGLGPNRIRFDNISAGSSHTCGIEAVTSIAYCWGINGSGQLGDGTSADRLAPIAIGGDALRFTSISAGWALSCGVQAATEFAYCWGSNHYGEIGDGTTTARRVPTVVGGGRQRFSIVSATGGANACGLEAQTGRAYCWGRYVGEVGDSPSAYRSEPTPVAGSLRFSSIVAAYNTACGVEAATGAGFCWSYRGLTPVSILPLLTPR